MKKLIALLLAVMLICLVFVGCSKPDPTNTDDGSNDDNTSEISAEVTESSDAGTPPDTSYSTGSPAADSYTAYTSAKTAMFSKLTDGLGSNSDYAFAALALMGPLMVDLTFIPVSMSGLGEEAVETALGMFSYADVEYTESGNTYTISYGVEETDDAGNKVKVVYTFVSTYDPATNGMISKASKDGVDVYYVEYRQTSFGWVSQYVLLDEDSSYVYQFAIQGEDGVFGMGEATTFPAPLTGNETIDFPKSLPTWYAVSGNTVTGLSDGEEINFEFTPTPST